ncbi:SPOSA6832_03079 [Sporobolomyces salmonicolor]|uniref:SPOSA6832_03079-mRNA-1:cds n=1 Tax=Sporidiobolus salmonicolor TaxID=5005 RepID=A0A0D6ENB8_SPOSA|nr:SPOSA6832_03079 [Sporobolomyces salmonicolor]
MSSSSATPALASATSAVASTSASASASAASASSPASYKLIGVLLAVGSGLFIGASFCLKKKGLIAAQKKAGGVAGEGHPYLRSWLWWSGMTLMVIGEVLNLVAYSFTDAILVTPLGALSVVVSNVLSHFVLKERLTTFGWLGSALCILGAIIIALNGPDEQTATTIVEFQKLFLSVGFLVWGSLVIVASIGMIWGKTHMLVYVSPFSHFKDCYLADTCSLQIGICSLLGGLSVACTSGLGASILTSIRGDNQFKHWFIYFLLAFVVVTLLSEINYLNKALELFNTAMVTPTYFVLFTSATLITSVILNKGFHTSAVNIVTIVLGFLVICCGITLLQLSKIDPEEIKSGVLDRRSTVLLSASRAEASHHAHLDAHEKGLDIEDPGIDALRGTAGAIGSIHRAISLRRNFSRAGSLTESAFDPREVTRRRGRNGAPGAAGSGPSAMEMGMQPVVRHQLYDEPMPYVRFPSLLTVAHSRSNDSHSLRYDAADKISLHSSLASPTFNPHKRSSTLKFADQDQVHKCELTILLDAPRLRDGSGGTVQHSLQPRAEGSHVHTSAAPSIPPLSADITSSTVSDFSAARSGSLFSTSAYTDPFTTPDLDNPTTPTVGSPPFPRSRGAYAVPRPSRAGSSSPSHRLSSDFPPSTRPIHHDSSVPDSPTPTPTRHRFALPSFGPSSRARTPSNQDHRAPHPKGPRDLEEQESEALVRQAESGNESGESESEGEGDESLGGRLEMFDSRDVL